MLIREIYIKYTLLQFIFPDTHTYAPMHTLIVSFSYKSYLFLNDYSQIIAFTMNLAMIRNWNRNSQLQNATTCKQEQE